MTRRQEITEVLKQRHWAPKELAEHFDAPLMEIIEDLEHIKNSTQSPYIFKHIPSKCTKCGFLFKGRSRINTPSKCPSCHSESIEEGKYFIRQN